MEPEHGAEGTELEDASSAPVLMFMTVRLLAAQPPAIHTICKNISETDIHRRQPDLASQMALQRNSRRPGIEIQQPPLPDRVGGHGLALPQRRAIRPRG